MAAPLLGVAVLYLWPRVRERLTVPNFQPRLTIGLPAKEETYGVTLSPDARFIVTASVAKNGNAGCVRVLDGHTGFDWHTFVDSSRYGMGSVAISPDSRLVAFAVDKTTIWNPDTGKRLRVLDKARLEGTVFSLAYGGEAVFAPDNRTLALSGQGTRLWDTTTGRFKGLATQPKGLRFGARSNELRPSFSYPRFSPDGKEIACLFTYHKPSSGLAPHPDNFRIQIWDVASRKRKSIVPIEAVNHFAWSPDGRRIVIICGKWDKQNDTTRTELTLYDLKTSRVVWTKTHTWKDARGKAQAYWLSRVAWSPNGRWLVASNGIGGINVSNVATGDLRLTLKPLPKRNAGGIFSASLCFSADGKTLLSARPHEIYLWDFEEIARYLEQMPS